MAKELVLYFSVYGTSKIVAEEIAKQTGADIREIEPVIPYDSNRDHYNALTRLAKKEHDEDQRPAIKNRIDITAYDRIYLGYPMWWYTFPMIIYTLIRCLSSMTSAERQSYLLTLTWVQRMAGLTRLSVNWHQGQGCSKVCPSKCETRRIIPKRQ